MTTELKLVKLRLNEGSQKAILIFTNRDCVSVYFFGISEDDFYRLIEQLASALYNFASHGSGWYLLEIKNSTAKFVSFSPIQGHSFILLPSNLRNCQSLISVRNIVDENCFFSIFLLLHTIFTRINFYFKQVLGDAKQAPIPKIRVSIDWPKSIWVSSQHKCHFQSKKSL